MRIAFAILLAVLITACGGEEPTPTAVPVPTFTSTPQPAQPPTATTEPTAGAILVPTATPASTPTEEPTVETRAIQVPVATEPEAVPAATEAPAPSLAGHPFTCAGGCATAPDPACDVKGNVNTKGEKIYHTRDDGSYNRTDIKPEEGDRWFCTIQEAIDAGFRGPEN